MNLPPALRDLCQPGIPIYALSPHIDDAIWSLGGVLHALAEAGCDITLVSIFSHTIYVYDEVRPPAEATAIRKAEDYTAVRQAGLKEVVFMDFPDGVLRDRPTSRVLDPTYQTPPYLLDVVRASLEKIIPPAATLLIPAGFGGHMDHLTTRRVGLLLEGHKVLYADLPYGTREHTGKEVSLFMGQNWHDNRIELPQKIIQDHMDLFWRYQSQSSQAVADEIEVYLTGQSIHLWTQAKESSLPSAKR